MLVFVTTEIVADIKFVLPIENSATIQRERERKGCPGTPKHVQTFLGITMHFLSHTLIPSYCLTLGIPNGNPGGMRRIGRNASFCIGATAYVCFFFFYEIKRYEQIKDRGIIYRGSTVTPITGHGMWSQMHR